MKLIVGLGNPGTTYQNTRHNVGFMVVDRLVKAHGGGGAVKGQFNAACVEANLGGERCLLIKPTTFMNKSGQSVGAAIRFYKLQPAADLLVIVDDIYLDVGVVRIKPSGGSGGHNGLTDIEQALGGDNYPRLRVGVGAKPSVMDQADYVLSRFREDEKVLLEGGLDRAAKAAIAFASKGLDAAMNQYNAPDRPPREKPPRPPGLNGKDGPPRKDGPPGKDGPPDKGPGPEGRGGSEGLRSEVSNLKFQISDLKFQSPDRKSEPIPKSSTG